MFDFNKTKEISILRKQTSQYAMGFDLLRRVANSENEENVIERIFETLEALFSPRELFYLSLKNWRHGKLYSSLPTTTNYNAARDRLANLDQPYGWTDSGKGFYVKIAHNKKEFGVLEVYDPALPEQKEHYLNLTLSMIDVFGLSIESARRYQKIKDAESLLRQEKEKLEEALFEVKKLSGLLPICSHCKKIRDDKGYWNQIETYIQARSEAQFSHSICQDCAREHYPDLNIYDE